MRKPGTLTLLAGALLALAVAMEVAPGAAQAPLPVAPKQPEGQKDTPSVPKEPEGQKEAPQGTPGAGAPKQTDAQKKVVETEAGRKAAENLAETQKKTQEAERIKAHRERSLSYQGKFSTDDLAGGYESVNELHVPLPASDLQGLPIGTLMWKGNERRRGCGDLKPTADSEGKVTIRSKVPHPETEKATSASVVKIEVPVPPCWWPVYQDADVKITGTVRADDGTTKSLPFFEGPARISVFWFPLLVTLLTVLLIYPGSAMTTYYANRARYLRDNDEAKREGKDLPKEPSFWDALDPIEITKNAFGRGSISKLQIYFFTIVIFAMLLFHLLRTGTIANMSTDVLMLLGISAVGAAGGKLVSTKRRRLGMANWAWLRRKEWLPFDTDNQSRAKWSELFLDGETKEFDPYSFQMAIFSFVVAVALVRTNLNGLGTFKIPSELLALLGISQIVYIGGRAIDGGSYAELEKKLEEVRTHETKHSDLMNKAEAAPTTAPADHKPPVTRDEFKAEAENERQAFKREIEQAGTIFWGIYSEQIGKKPDALENLSDMEPTVYKPKSS